MIHVSYYCFNSLSFKKFVNSTPDWLKSTWYSNNDNKFNKGSLEFYNDRFVDNYESSLLDLVF